MMASNRKSALFATAAAVSLLIAAPVWLATSFPGAAPESTRRRPVRVPPSERFSAPYLNVRDFGALGDDFTDDSDAIQRAIDSLSDTDFPGGKVFFPPGGYRVKKTIRIRTGVTLEGANRRNTSLIGNIGVMAVISRDPTGGSEQDITIRQMGVRPLDPSAIAIDFQGITQSKIEDLFISTWVPQSSYSYYSDGTIGIRLEAGYPLYSCNSNSIRDVRMENLGVGIQVRGGASQQLIDHVDFGAKWGLWIEGPHTHAVVQNSRFQSMPGGAALIWGSPQSVSFLNSYFENLRVGLRVVSSSDVPMLFNNFLTWNVDEFISLAEDHDVWAVRLTADVPNVIRVGERSQWRAEVFGGEGRDLLYRYSFTRPSQPSWVVLRDYSHDPRYVFEPRTEDVGSCRLAVTIADAGDANTQLASTSVPVRVIRID